MTYHLIISGPPRTKKNHGRIVRNGGRVRMLPSEAWEEWKDSALVWYDDNAAGKERVFLWFVRGNGFPITANVNCRALFYRDKNCGDAVGYYQGLADLLEHRGIVANDRQIVSWDGSRLIKDTDNPRVELWLEEVSE